MSQASDDGGGQQPPVAEQRTVEVALVAFDGVVRDLQYLLESKLLRFVSLPLLECFLRLLTLPAHRGVDVGAGIEII